MGMKEKDLSIREHFSYYGFSKNEIEMIVQIYFSKRKNFQQARVSIKNHMEIYEKIETSKKKITENEQFKIDYHEEKLKNSLKKGELVWLSDRRNALISKETKTRAIR